MTFKSDALFPGPLLDGAERYAREVTQSTPDASIIGEIGWNGTLLAEEHGGFGGTIHDLASIVEGMAARAVNLPILTRCGIVPAILNALPSNEHGELRNQFASAAACIEWGGPLSRQEGPQIPRLHRAESSDWTMTGTLAPVELGPECTHVMFAGLDAGSDETSIILVEASRVGSLQATHLSVEGRKMSAIPLSALQLTDADILAKGAVADHALTSAWRTAQALISADIVCTMNYALAETIAYLSQRKQFGQALAQFQVLRHDVAKLYVSFENCKGLLMSTMRLLVDKDEAGTGEAQAAFDLLGLYVREQAVEFAQGVIQLHGGMGMTRETLAARQATRLIALAFRFGDAYSHTKALQSFQGANAK